MQLDILRSASERRLVTRLACEIYKQHFVIGKANVDTLNLAPNQ